VRWKSEHWNKLFVVTLCQDVPWSEEIQETVCEDGSYFHFKTKSLNMWYAAKSSQILFYLWMVIFLVGIIFSNNNDNIMVRFSATMEIVINQHY
jgi:hypothetical protein